MTADRVTLFSTRLISLSSWTSSPLSRMADGRSDTQSPVLDFFPDAHVVFTLRYPLRSLTVKLLC